MGLLHHDKFVCEYDNEKFKTYDDLIAHTRHVHHHPIVKCRECGKEFIHEKDRLHHVREEHAKEVDYRTHKDSYKTKKKGISPQEGVNEAHVHLVTIFDSHLQSRPVLDIITGICEDEFTGLSSQIKYLHFTLITN